MAHSADFLGSSGTSVCLDSRLGCRSSSPVTVWLQRLPAQPLSLKPALPT